MNWHFLVAKQALLVRLPFGNALRRLKRHYLGYKPDPSNLLSTLSHFDQMSNSLEAMGRSFKGATVLEIGSGWFPTIPITLALGGAKHVFMTDLTPHMDSVTFAETVRFLQEYRPNTPRLREFLHVSDLAITYLAPFDPNDVPNGSVDYIISRTVLEHIPPVDLENLFIALLPKLSTNGMMIHIVDHSDHLEHTDKSISKINFLTWSKRKHRFINWLLKGGENRLRHDEYVSIFNRIGYRVVLEESSAHQETLAATKTLLLSEPYSDMSPEQISILTSMYILAPDVKSTIKS